MLDVDATAPATVIIERLRRGGYDGGITILKEYLREVRSPVHRGEELPAHVVSAGRDRPDRLVRAPDHGSGRSGCRTAGVRCGDDAAAFSGARDGVHVVESDARFLAGVHGHDGAVGWRTGEDGRGSGNVDRGAAFSSGPSPYRGRSRVRGVPDPARSSCRREVRSRKGRSNARSGISRRRSWLCELSRTWRISNLSTTTGRRRQRMGVITGVSVRRSLTREGSRKGSWPDPGPVARHGPADRSAGHEGRVLPDRRRRLLGAAGPVGSASAIHDLSDRDRRVL